MPPPQIVRARLAEHLPLGPQLFVLRFAGCEALAAALPGQFVMLRGGEWGTDPLLPRAFSLAAVRGEGGEVDVLVKTTGKASARLERARRGEEFSLLGPLGHPFPPPPADGRHWLVAGGVGLAPLLMHAVRAATLGLSRQLTLFYGGRTASDLVLVDEIVATGAELVLITQDGSRGLRGMVTDALCRAFDRNSPADVPTLLACGPEAMLAAVARLAHRRSSPAYLSLEGEMACGIGACLACAVPCHSRRYRYACLDGPVFSLADLAGPYAAEGS